MILEWPTDALMENTLYYGDNLDILRRYIPDNSIHLVYLDPPFKSDQSYNILYKEKNGTESAAQIKVFEDTWHWDRKAEETFIEITEKAPKKVADLVVALRSFLGSNDMMAYLVMMAIRLVELRRVLKEAGSIYLHCDPTASHYLKLILDAVFDAQNFKNEIIWKRRTGRTSYVHESKRFGTCTDSIFFYGKSDQTRFNPQYSFNDPSYKEYIDKFFRHVDEEGRRYRIADLSNPAPRPNLMYEYKGYKPPRKGWAISKEKMEQWDKEGRLYFPKNKTGRIQRKRFLNELKGKPVQSLWDDIDPIGAQAAERLGYPTQKPEILLERIINASSDQGDIVLDPFCGCGTTIIVAEKLKRRWIGMDVTHLAISLMRHRLKDTFGERVKFDVRGEPLDLHSAEELARQDPYQFQWWAVGKAGGMPAESEKKKGKDTGIDGYLYFHDEPQKTKKIVMQVKSGHVNPGQIRDLKGVVEREKAEIGVFICLHEPTLGMRREALSSGFYKSPGWNKNYQKIQLLTIKELLAGRGIDYPPKTSVTFKKAEKHEKENGEQLKLKDKD